MKTFGTLGQCDGPASLGGVRCLHAHYRASTLGIQGGQEGEGQAGSHENGKGERGLHGCVCVCGEGGGGEAVRRRVSRQEVVGSRGMGRVG